MVAKSLLQRVELMKCIYEYNSIMSHFDLPKVSREPGESMKAYNSRRWHLRRRYQRKEKRVGAERKCPFCGILLISHLVAIKQKRYCDECRNDPDVKRHLRALYQRRFQQKKKGQEQDTLTHAEEE